jgi:oxygen-dependent protoporphyrinogen oxidase
VDGVRAVVVGGGIAGLSAALALRERWGAAIDITIVEQAGRLGGKLHTGALAGAPVEHGAESFLMWAPGGGPSRAAWLAERAGLGGELRHPVVGRAALAIDGTLRAIPGGTLMGVPADPDSVRAIADAAGGADADGGRPLLGPGDDVAVGDLVRVRMGPQVVDRLVDPLLGGVYAGRADDLSLAATVPALADACRTEPTLRGAVRAALARQAAARSSIGPAAGPPPVPVFGAVDGGMNRLVEAVARAGGATVMLGLPVRELHREAGGWRLLAGSTRDPVTIEADAVVLACPARPAARLLAGLAPDAAAEIGKLDYASMALVAYALPAVALPPLSGFLVPPSEGRAVKALTIFTTKWGPWPDGRVALRASVGRYGDQEALQLTDADLTAVVREELGELLDTALPEPDETRVSRWGGGLPQYRPGHLDRVARARAALAGWSGLALAGAAYDGVGIPACIGSGVEAAETATIGWKS